MSYAPSSLIVRRNRARACWVLGALAFAACTSESDGEGTEQGSAGAGAPSSAGAGVAGSPVSGGSNPGGTGGGSPIAGASPSESGGSTPGGSPSEGGTRAGGGSEPTAGDGGSDEVGGTNGPELPPIAGACPELRTGTATIGGLAGISLQVGPKQAGTGSLVFYWHGTGSTAGEVNSLMPAAVRQEILESGGIIVSFGGSTKTGGDCSGTGTFSKDDFKIADLIAACAVRDHAIDPRRIYTTGCSAGGLQAGCMGALRSSYVAAVVPNSGGVVSSQPIQDAKQTPAVMTMHGGTSDKVIVSFSQTSAAYDKQMKNAGSFVVNCDHGGGHCAAPGELYKAGWQFMKDHPFGEPTEPYSSALPASFPDYCSIY